MSFNDLFMQILESEQKARERKSLFNEIKGKISLVSQQLQSTREEVNRLQTEISAKLKELSAEELECQWIHARASILEEQLAEQRKQKQQYDEDVQKLHSSQAQVRDKFMADMSTFVCDFGLTESGQERRTLAVKDELLELRAKQDQLNAELDVFNQQKEMLLSIELEKVATEKETALLKETTKDMEERMEKERMKTKQLEERKTQVARKPHSDREFKRLQAELDACRDDSLEGLCQALQQQIDQLQRQQWQQQLHRQYNTVPTRQESRDERANKASAGPKTARQSTARSMPFNKGSQETHTQSNASVSCSKVYPSTSTKTNMDTTATATHSSSSGKPNLAKLRNALKCKADDT